MLLNSKKSLLARLIAPIFFVCVIIFLILYADKIAYEKIRDIDPNLTYLVLSLVFGIFFRFWSAFAWVVILKNCVTVKTPGFFSLNSVYAKSWMGRYIPGKIAWIAGKVYFGGQYGIDKTRLAIVSFLEAFLQVLIITGLAIVFLVLSGNSSSVPEGILYACILILSIFFIILSPPVFNYFASIAYKLINKKPLDFDEKIINVFFLLRTTPLYIVSFLATGTSYYFLCLSLAGQPSLELYIFVIGVFNFAGMIGLVSFFAPSGIGVRDAIQALFLALIFTVEEVLVIVVAARLWSLLLDVLYFFVSTALDKLSASKI